MPKPVPALRLAADRFRSALFAAQALPARPRTVVEAVEQSGFVRTLGGIDVYLAVRARVSSMRRADLDAAVARRELQVVPAMRGCMYLAPQREVPWALRIADLLSRRQRERDRERAGIRPRELDKVAGAVIDVLREHGPLAPHALRKAMPKGLVRSLGERGKKVGVSSPLPAALRNLEFAGRVERTLEDGRLDSERYLWRAAETDPFAGSRVPTEPSAVYAHFAELYWKHAGLGTVESFGSWAGLTKRDAAAAAATIDLEPVVVDDLDGLDGLGDLQRSASTRIGDGKPGVSGVALLPFEDNLVHLQGGPARLIEPAHRQLEVPSWGDGKARPLGETRHMAFRTIVVDGRIVGFWEYHPDEGTVVPAYLQPLSATRRKAVEAAARELSAFIAEELGHGRSFSLDTDDDLRRRTTQLRGLTRH